jgi:hypothetical protein
LFNAVSLQDVEMTRFLLEAECQRRPVKTDPCRAASQRRSYPGRGTVLHVAIPENPPCNVELLSLLLAYGGEVDAKDDYGYTALHHAYSNPECARILLQAGAAPTVVATDGQTAADMAGYESGKVIEEYGGATTNWVRATCATVSHEGGEPQFRLWANNRCRNRPESPIRCHYSVRWGCSDPGPLTHVTAVWCPADQNLTTDEARCGELGSGRVRFDKKTGNYPVPDFCPGSPQTWRTDAKCEIRLPKTVCDASTGATWDGKKCVPAP